MYEYCHMVQYWYIANSEHLGRVRVNGICNVYMYVSDCHEIV